VIFEKVRDKHKHEHTIVTQHDNNKNARGVKKKGNMDMMLEH
jgi:hypothetical protein